MACILPLELVEVIIDELYSDSDTNALANCSLACKAWLPSTRRRLFANVQLFNGEHFSNLLNCPSVIYLIRHIDITTRRCHPEDWLIEHFPRLVRFVGLKSFSVSSVDFRSLDTHSMAAGFSNFATIVRLSLEDVRFTTFCNFVEFIGAFPNLQSIRIVWTDWIPGVLSPLAHSYLPCNLQHLEMAGPFLADILSWLLSSETTPAIRSISVCPFHSSEPKTVGKFLRAIGNTLENISWTALGIRYNVLRQYVDLSHNIQLRVIHFTLDHCWNTEFVPEILSQILSTHMEEVSFIIYSSPDDLDRLVDWSRLETIFALPQFSRLTKIQIFCMGSLRLDDSARFKDYLPECHARGILFVVEGHSPISSLSIFRAKGQFIPSTITPS